VTILFGEDKWKKKKKKEKKKLFELKPQNRNLIRATEKTRWEKRSRVARKLQIKVDVMDRCGPSVFHFYNMTLLLIFPLSILDTRRCVGLYTVPFFSSALFCPPIGTVYCLKKKTKFEYIFVVFRPVLPAVTFLPPSTCARRAAAFEGLKRPCRPSAAAPAYTVMSKAGSRLGFSGLLTPAIRKHPSKIYV
jgi:hypothetical protein